MHVWSPGLGRPDLWWWGRDWRILNRYFCSLSLRRHGFDLISQFLCRWVFDFLPRKPGWKSNLPTRGTNKRWGPRKYPWQAFSHCPALRGKRAWKISHNLSGFAVECGIAAQPALWYQQIRWVSSKQRQQGNVPDFILEIPESPWSSASPGLIALLLYRKKNIYIRSHIVTCHMVLVTFSRWGERTKEDSWVRKRRPREDVEAAARDGRKYGLRARDRENTQAHLAHLGMEGWHQWCLRVTLPEQGRYASGGSQVGAVLFNERVVSIQQFRWRSRSGRNSHPLNARWCCVTDSLNSQDLEKQVLAFLFTHKEVELDEARWLTQGHPASRQQCQNPSSLYSTPNAHCQTSATSSAHCVLTHKADLMRITCLL